MAVITILLALDRFPGLEVLPYVAGDFCGFPNWLILLRQYRWAFSQIPFKLMVQCRSVNRPSSISYPVPDISVTSSLSGSGSISAKMKDDCIRPLLLGVPQDERSSS